MAWCIIGRTVQERVVIVLREGLKGVEAGHVELCCLVDAVLAQRSLSRNNDLLLTTRQLMEL